MRIEKRVGFALSRKVGKGNGTGRIFKPTVIFVGKGVGKGVGRGVGIRRVGILVGRGVGIGVGVVGKFGTTAVGDGHVAGNVMGGEGNGIVGIGIGNMVGEIVGILV